MARILQVFNRYLFMGGEEKSVDRIYSHLGQEHEMARCFFESRDWTGPQAPGKLGQLKRTLYNWDARAQLEQACASFQPDALLFHNAFPVGSPSVYHAAHFRRVPIIHYIHNFRPFSVGGTLYHQGQFLEEALRGDYRREVLTGAWQGSKLKSAIMAMVLRRLHHSGWLNQVKAWVCISEFLKDKLVQGARLPADTVHALRHSWDAMPEAPVPEDGGYYLFLARLVEAKGVEVLLTAWQMLEDRLKDQTPELWIGGEGPLQGLVEQAAQRSRKIRFLGLIQGEQKHEVIRRCRAMLAPSVWWEPLGLVTYEAYDFAKPMLAARSGGLIETVVHGETGFLYTPGSTDQLCDAVRAMESMLSDQRKAMGQKGRQWLLKWTAVPAWKQRMNAIVQSVLAS